MCGSWWFRACMLVCAQGRSAKAQVSLQAINAVFTLAISDCS